jgi:hypothetical protein
MTPFPEAWLAVDDAVRAVIAAVQPWAAGDYLNFSENAAPGDELFGAETHARLREVKRAYDPGDVIRSNHPVEPA